MESERFIDGLPLVSVARAWGLNVTTYGGAERVGAAGYYRRGQSVALGVENMATWAHELVHAADDRLAPAFAKRAREIAEAEGLNGKPDSAYLRLVQRCRNNMRAVLQAVESGEMLE